MASGFSTTFSHIFPPADPASIYDFDEEEEDAERQLTLDMTPIRAGKSRFSAAINAAAAKSPKSPKSPSYDFEFFRMLHSFWNTSSVFPKPPVNSHTDFSVSDNHNFL